MDNLFESLLEPTADSKTRRVNNAVFISKHRNSEEEEDGEDSGTDESDSFSIGSTLTSCTLKAPFGYLGEGDHSDSSSNTIVKTIVPKRKEYDPEAFKKWLEAKNETERKRKEKNQTRKKREETKKKLAEEKRKQEAEEKMKKWMERKELERQRRREQQARSKNQEKQEKMMKKWIPNDESAENFRAWLSRVKQQDEQTKLRHLSKLRMEDEVKQERSNVAKIKYDEWLKTSPSKPKPVPLNRGIESLRGSISKMFINPTPWKSNLE